MAIQRRKASNKRSGPDATTLPGKPWPPFYLAHHPKGWEVVGGRWLPRIKRIDLLPGVNGGKTVMGRRHGKLVPVGVDGTLVKASLERQGWQFLDEDITVLVHDDDGELVEEAGYLEQFDGARGTFHCMPWDNPRIIGWGSEARADRGDFDSAAFDAWRRWLVDEGIVQPPHEVVLRAEVERQRARTNRSASIAHDGSAPALKERAETEKARLEETEKATEAAKPQPKPKRTRRKTRAKKKAANAEA